MLITFPLSSAGAVVCAHMVSLVQGILVKRFHRKRFLRSIGNEKTISQKTLRKPVSQASTRVDKRKTAVDRVWFVVSYYSFRTLLPTSLIFATQLTTIMSIRAADRLTYISMISMHSDTDVKRSRHSLMYVHNVAVERVNRKGSKP
uniref:Putative secreted protein n=1 Tax=Anopheles darlingi TaxID=43151 RepID=A0A2M4DPG7_ANODA